jgi:hypothetical protein
MLDEIIDYQKTADAVAVEQKLQVTASGNIVQRQTTKGWNLCVLWKDG